MISKSIGLLAILGIIVTLPAFAQEETDRVSIVDPKLVNQSTNPIGESINVQQPVQVSAEITNNQDISQKIAYIVQIKDAEEIIISVKWFTGTLEANDTKRIGVQWIPKNAGEYTIEIFVWEGFPVNHNALSKDTALHASVS